jgi:hypothetical protein
MRLSFFSMRAAQEAQVMPPMVSSTSEVETGAVLPGAVSAAVLVIAYLLGEAGTHGVRISGAVRPGVGR